MDAEDFDPCQCITRWRMRQLLSLIRETQSQCTDTECFTTPRRLGFENDGNDLNFTMLFMVVGLIMLLYMFRPGSMRLNQILTENSPKIKEITNSNDNPPGPPPATN